MRPYSVFAICNGYGGSLLRAYKHLSGEPKPSGANKQIPKALVVATNVLEIRFLDHITLGREGKGYFSFRENGLL